MKLLKENQNPTYQKLAGLEKYLQENNISISNGYNGLEIRVDSRVLSIRDIEDDQQADLPRTMDSERFIIDE